MGKNCHGKTFDSLLLYVDFVGDVERKDNVDNLAPKTRLGLLSLVRAVKKSGKSWRQGGLRASVDVGETRSVGKNCFILAYFSVDFGVFVLELLPDRWLHAPSLIVLWLGEDCPLKYGTIQIIIFPKWFEILRKFLYQNYLRPDSRTTRPRGNTHDQTTTNVNSVDEQNCKTYKSSLLPPNKTVHRRTSIEWNIKLTANNKIPT